jgi:hypothetical protein
VTLGIGVLSLPEPGKSMVSALYPFDFKSGIILFQLQTPCQTHGLKYV